MAVNTLQKSLKITKKKDGIHHGHAVPKIPEQNGVVERMNRTLVETVRAILSDSKLH